MNKYFLIATIITFFFICIDGLAQNFFPLSIGNQYQFKDDWNASGPGNYNEHGTDYYDYSITKDSLIEGVIFYAIPGSYGRPFEEEYFFRFDSLQQKLFIRIPGNDTTRLAVDFNAPQDSQYISYIRGVPKEFTSEGLSFQTVLGDTHSVYKMSYVGDLLTMLDYYFADQIGLIKYSYISAYMNTSYQSTQNLISAIIDSTILSPIILEVDTLYPIMDRPIDTFPFLLSIPYTSSYYALIDSFYISVELAREDSIIQTYKFDISIYNPRLSFYLGDLEIGDIIKLRATITDTSIYNNIDFYPDTGLAIINVLPPILEVEIENRIYSYKLEQNYPNPFNPTTLIKYQIPELTFATLKVYDVLGNEIATVVNEEKPTGNFEVEFDGDGLTSGIYFYQLKAGNYVETKKMILLR